jgi:hypothetical protein
LGFEVGNAAFQIGNDRIRRLCQLFVELRSAVF